MASRLAKLRVGQIAAMASLGVCLVMVLLWLAPSVVTFIDHAGWFGPRPCEDVCFSRRGGDWWLASGKVERFGFYLVPVGIALGILGWFAPEPRRRTAAVGIALSLVMVVLLYYGMVVPSYPA